MKSIFFRRVGMLVFFGVVCAIFVVTADHWRRQDGGRVSFVAFADDDEGDDDDDEGDDNEAQPSKQSSESTRKTSSKKTVMQTVTKQVITYETRFVNDPEFLVDTDGDLLVDAIDPEPNVDQREYFTDTDDDGVPNAFDQYHNEDDFSYHEDTDTNNDGILDSYEQ